MAIETNMHVRIPTRSYAYLDLLQMLSGAGLVLFMWAHLVMVSSVIIGPDTMNALAHFFEVTYLVHMGGPLIGIIFLFHFAMAVRKVPFHLGQQNLIWHQAKMIRHTDTWLWIVQAMTAMLILVMGSIHMWVVLTDLPITAAKSAARVQSGAWIIFYLMLLPLVELHVSIGFYRIGIKWGVVKRRSRANAKKLENVLTLIFISIGLLTLLRFWLLAL